MSTCCDFTASVAAALPPANSKMTSWLARVSANGGAAPSTRTYYAINTLFNDMDTCGVSGKILSMCLFVPDSLIAARTPLIVGATDPWTNTGFVAGDLTVNGLTANGGKYLDPGVTPAFSTLTQTSSCLFFYAYNANTAATGTEFGCFDGGTDNAFVSNFNSGGLQTFSDLLGQGARLTVATPGNGFYMASRIASNNNKIYFANSTTPWSAIASNAVAGSPLITVGFLNFAFNSNGTPIQGCNSTLSCSGIAKGLTTTEGQCLYNAVQACRVTLLGGFR